MPTIPQHVRHPQAPHLICHPEHTNDTPSDGLRCPLPSLGGNTAQSLLDAELALQRALREAQQAIRTYVETAGHGRNWLGQEKHRGAFLNGPETLHEYLRWQLVYSDARASVLAGEVR